jgi:hypothetical protein
MVFISLVLFGSACIICCLGYPHDGFGYPHDGFGYPHDGFGYPRDCFGYPHDGFGEAFSQDMLIEISLEANSGWLCPPIGDGSRECNLEKYT